MWFLLSKDKKILILKDFLFRIYSEEEGVSVKKFPFSNNIAGQAIFGWSVLKILMGGPKIFLIKGSAVRKFFSGLYPSKKQWKKEELFGAGITSKYC